MENDECSRMIMDVLGDLWMFLNVPTRLNLIVIIFMRNVNSMQFAKKIYQTMLTMN